MVSCTSYYEICRQRIFSYESFHARKKKNWVPMSYLQEEYKIRRWVFLSCKSLNSGKRRIFFADKLHTRASTGKPRKPLSLPGLVYRHKKGMWESKEKKRKEKDQGRQEGGSSKGKVPCALNQEFLFFGSRVFGFRSVSSWLKYWLLQDLVYEEAMCKGSSGKGLLYAVKAVP